MLCSIHLYYNININVMLYTYIIILILMLCSKHLYYNININVMFYTLIQVGRSFRRFAHHESTKKRALFPLPGVLPRSQHNAS